MGAAGQERALRGGEVGVVRVLRLLGAEGERVRGVVVPDDGRLAPDGVGGGLRAGLRAHSRRRVGDRLVRVDRVMWRNLQGEEERVKGLLFRLEA